MCTLTKREIEILRLISYEKTSREIAQILNLSPHTVVSHKRKILSKLKAKNVAGMVRRGFELDILKIDGSPSSWNLYRNN